MGKPTPQGFTDPVALPKDEKQAKRWQDLNRTWWETHAMRYDWKERIPYSEFSKEFYLEIDRRFFSQAQEYLPWKETPFDSLIPFHSIWDKDVLEIGVGAGSHAQLFCQYACTFTGIDITNYAVQSVRRRAVCFDLKGAILQMDAEAMGFRDNSFNFVWSWGVIHHSSNTRTVLKEIHRVLKPGGVAIIMVYHRGWWNYYVTGGLFWGLTQGKLLRTSSLHKIVQEWSDGALARYYSASEWRRLTSEFFRVRRIQVFGPKTDLLPVPRGSLKRALMRALPCSATRFLTNRCRMGSLLVSWLEK